MYKLIRPSDLGLWVSKYEYGEERLFANQESRKVILLHHNARSRVAEDTKILFNWRLASSLSHDLLARLGSAILSYLSVCIILADKLKMSKKSTLSTQFL